MAQGGNTYSPEVQVGVIADQLQVDIVAGYHREVETAKAHAEEKLRLVKRLRRYGLGALEAMQAELRAGAGRADSPVALLNN